MKQPLKKTIEFFATTELEANSLVTENETKAFIKYCKRANFS